MLHFFLSCRRGISRTQQTCATWGFYSSIRQLSCRKPASIGSCQHATSHFQLHLRLKLKNDPQCHGPFRCHFFQKGCSIRTPSVTSQSPLNFLHCEAVLTSTAFAAALSEHPLPPYIAGPARYNSPFAEAISPLIHRRGKEAMVSQLFSLKQTEEIPVDNKHEGDIYGTQIEIRSFRCLVSSAYLIEYLKQPAATCL